MRRSTHLAALAAALVIGIPSAAQAQETVPTLVPPAEGSEWLRGLTTEQFFGRLRVREAMGGNYPIEHGIVCHAMRIDSNGDVQARGMSEPTEVRAGMSGLQACGGALRRMDGGELIPGGMFFDTDIAYPQTDVFLMTPEHFMGPEEVDGMFVADELTLTGGRMANPEEEFLIALEIGGPWTAALVFLTPAGAEDFTSRPIVVVRDERTRE